MEIKPEPDHGSAELLPNTGKLLHALDRALISHPTLALHRFGYNQFIERRVNDDASASMRSDVAYYELSGVVKQTKEHCSELVEEMDDQPDELNDHKQAELLYPPHSVVASICHATDDSDTVIEASRVDLLDEEYKATNSSITVSYSSDNCSIDFRLFFDREKLISYEKEIDVPCSELFELVDAYGGDGLFELIADIADGTLPEAHIAAQLDIIEQYLYLQFDTEKIRILKMALYRHYTTARLARLTTPCADSDEFTSDDIDFVIQKLESITSADAA